MPGGQDEAGRVKAASAGAARTVVETPSALGLGERGVVKVGAGVAAAAAAAGSRRAAEMVNWRRAAGRATVSVRLRQLRQIMAGWVVGLSGGELGRVEMGF